MKKYLLMICGAGIVACLLIPILSENNPRYCVIAEGTFTLNEYARLPKGAKGSMTFVVLPDRTGEDPSYVDQIFDSTCRVINSYHPDLVVMVGDQIQGSTDSATDHGYWIDWLDTIDAKIDAPFVSCPGNHDLYYNNITGDHWYPQRSGFPLDFAFTSHDNLFLIWNYTTDYDEPDANDLEFLTSTLTENQGRYSHVFIVNHSPSWWNHQLVSYEIVDTLHELFQNAGVTAVFNGHYHTYHARPYDGIEYIITGRAGGLQLNTDSTIWEPQDSGWTDPAYDNHGFVLVTIDTSGTVTYQQIVTYYEDPGL